MKKVYLLWHAYVTKELLTIASLTKKNNENYIFKYETDALKAKQLGCFLPFEYTEEEITFKSLPMFFSQRMLTSKYYIEKLGINYKQDDELSLLAYGNSIKNNDNFRIISEEEYENFKEILKNNYDNKIEKSFVKR